MRWAPNASDDGLNNGPNSREKRMSNRGTLTVICGPMFSGKSRELIRTVHIAEIASQEALLFKAGIDRRYSIDDVASHDGVTMAARRVDTAREIIPFVRNSHTKPAVVAVDEGQFFDTGLTPVCIWLRHQGMRVVVAGLDRNFRGEPFGPMPELLAIADEVVKLRAVCMRCKDPRVTATLPQRLIDGQPAPYDSPEILVGGSESYEARCLNCHEVPGRPDSAEVIQGMLDTG
jgi:thymidine kinase